MGALVRVCPFNLKEKSLLLALRLRTQDADRLAGHGRERRLLGRALAGLAALDRRTGCGRLLTGPLVAQAAPVEQAEQPAVALPGVEPGRVRNHFKALSLGRLEHCLALVGPGIDGLLEVAEAATQDHIHLAVGGLFGDRTEPAPRLCVGVAAANVSG